MMIYRNIFLLLSCLISFVYAQNQCISPRGKQGRCTAVGSCPEIIRIIQRHRQSPNVNDANIIRKAVENCGNFNSNQQVCCEVTQVNNNGVPSRPQPQPRPPTTSISSSSSSSSGSCSIGNGKVGKCEPLTNCPAMNIIFRRYQSTRSQNDANIIRESLLPCQHISKTYFCCVIERTRNQNPTTTIFQQGFQQKNGIQLLDRQKCGRSIIQDFIVGGVDAELGEWPWMALMFGARGSGRATVFCGGALISESYVLSAAHCFKQTSSVKLKYVRLGEHDLRSNPDCKGTLCAPNVQDIQVENIIRHPQYQKSCRECDDISLLRLASAANLNSRFVNPVCLPIDPHRDIGIGIEELNGKFAFATGWGTTNKNPATPVTPDILQEVNLPIQELAHCRRLKASYPNKKSVICAGGEEKDSCTGDSGGPLSLPNKRNTQYFIVGITSIGAQACGVANLQGLYTSVHEYIPWILQNLRQ